MRRTVKILDPHTKAIISCHILKKLPDTSITISNRKHQIIETEGIRVGITGDFRFAKPWESNQFEAYDFFRCRTRDNDDTISPEPYYFCAKPGYMIVCVPQHYAPEMIAESHRAMTAEDLKDKFSQYLQEPSDTIQIRDIEGDSLIAEYDPAND